jgi:hypothetical protein
MNDRAGIFWFRGYDGASEEKMSRRIDSTLQKIAVKHIITGHTVVADTVSVYYGGRIFNVDTKHAEGKSEALYIEDNTYHRVNDKGQRILIRAFQK